ncbi:MAG TPA: wax ester/triacylglycerol synthase family O-acyltransferase [Propionicimonas sp.]|nr:wax ester/triacylglycerol synthase family O-acyltransferase [Propionicimonas sp.]
MSDPVSVAEAALLARDQAQQPWQQAFVCLLDGDLTRQDLIDRVTDRIGFAPRFARVVAGWPRPVWVDDDGFSVAGHVREHTLGAGERLQDWLAGRLATPLDRAHPLWQAWLVHGAAGAMPAVVVLSHPALVDGYDHVHLLQELFDDGPGPLGGGGTSWRPASERDPGWAGLLGLDDPLGAVKGLAGSLGGMLENAVRTIAASPRGHHVAGVEVDLATLAGIRRRHGCTTHDVLVALVTAGFRGWLLDQGAGAGDEVALVPLAVTEPDVLESAIGCRVAPEWIALPVSEPSSVQRLAIITSLTRARLDTGVSVPARDLVDLAGFAPPTLHSLAAGTVAAGRPHRVLLSNAPGPAQPRYLGRARVTGLYSLLATTDAQQFTASVSSYRGRVTIGVVATAPATHLARDVSAELGALRVEH